jgi:hypothetical protein
VSAGGGPILVVKLGTIEVRVGNTVREGASVSVVKPPPAPNCPGYVYEDVPEPAPWVNCAPCWGVTDVSLLVSGVATEFADASTELVGLPGMLGGLCVPVGT